MPWFLEQNADGLQDPSMRPPADTSREAWEIGLSPLSMLMKMSSCITSSCITPGVNKMKKSNKLLVCPFSKQCCAVRVGLASSLDKANMTGIGCWPERILHQSDWTSGCFPLRFDREAIVHVEVIEKSTCGLTVVKHRVTKIPTRSCNC